MLLATLTRISKLMEFLMESNREISAELLNEVKAIAFKSFDNGKLHDVDMCFSIDEVGEDIILVGLHFEQNVTYEDIKGRFRCFLPELMDACEREHPYIWPMLTFKHAETSL